MRTILVVLSKVRYYERTELVDARNTEREMAGSTDGQCGRDRTLDENAARHFDTGDSSGTDVQTDLRRGVE